MTRETGNFINSRPLEPAVRFAEAELRSAVSFRLALLEVDFIKPLDLDIKKMLNIWYLVRNGVAFDRIQEITGEVGPASIVGIYDLVVQTDDPDIISARNMVLEIAEGPNQRDKLRTSFFQRVNELRRQSMDNITISDELQFEFPGYGLNDVNVALSHQIVSIVSSGRPVNEVIGDLQRIGLSEEEISRRLEVFYDSVWLGSYLPRFRFLRDLEDETDEPTMVKMDRFRQAPPHGISRSDSNLYLLGLYLLEGMRLYPDLMKQLPFIDGKTVEFLHAATNDGTYVRKPGRIKSMKNWLLALNSLGLFFGTQLTMEEVAYAQGLQLHQVHKLIQRATRILRARSPEAQAILGEGEHLSRPHNQRMSARKSRRRGGVAIAVTKGLADGLTVEEIAAENGISTAAIYRSLRLVEKWGFNIAPLKHIDLAHWGEEIDRLAEDPANDAVVQQWLDKIVDDGKYAALTKGPNSPVVSLKQAIEQEFHYQHYSAPIYREAVLAAIPSVPIGTFARPHKHGGGGRYFIARKHIPRLLEILKKLQEEDDKMKKLLQPTVEHVFGPVPQVIPRQHQIVSRGQRETNFTALRDIMVDIGLFNVRGYGKLFDDTCPVTVYRYRGSYYCNKADVEVMASYLRQRAVTLEII